MPFTPFHLGPGAVFKAVGGRRFSFLVFGGTQVLMDIEPLLGILRHQPILHGYTHTLAGALLIGVAAALTGRPASRFVLRRLAIPHDALTWPVAFASAFIGTYSHIALDAVMHADMRPWWPLATGNGLLGSLPLGVLHLLCAGAAVVGAVALAVRAALRRYFPAG